MVIRTMRSVKKEVLKLMQQFVLNAQDSDKETIYKNFLPALMEPVLDDYRVRAFAFPQPILSLLTIGVVLCR